jgi:tripartite-type tricarboxylate transporter receptor subunit TctC
VVPFPPGAATDALARIIGQKLAESVGQPVVVDNRAGAGGTLGTDVVAKAVPDGHTLLMVGAAHAINASLYARLPFDPQRDFAAVTLVAFLPNALIAHPGVPATNVKELIALAKAKPGQLNYASGGSGSTAHLAMELLKTSAGIDVVHVPYKGGGQAMNDLLGGQVSLLFTSLYSAQSQVKAGKLRALGVASAKRTPFAPELPTIAESGLPGYEVIAWYGVMVPAQTPPAVVTRLHAEIAKGLKTPDSEARFASQGAELVVSTPPAFAAHVQAEIAKWAKVVKATGARVD